jgi:kynurenine formamidase
VKDLPVRDLLEVLARHEVYDLAQPFFAGMPHFPTHPPYLFGLTRKHGDMTWEGGASSAADAIAFGGHVGTHIDALCHFSCDGRLHGGIQAAAVQSLGGFSELGVDTVAPILRRGVMLDIANEMNVAELPPDFSIAPAHLESAAKSAKVSVEAGDVVLLRTGWARYYPDAARYLTGGPSGHAVTGPGPELDAARWLSERGVFAAGSDTIAFEKVPAARMPVHVHLLVENGIYIIEALDLETLARNRIYEFVFMAAPLKFRGGTGSPIRPLALA